MMEKLDIFDGDGIQGQGPSSSSELRIAMGRSATARSLGVSTSTIDRLAATGVLHPCRVFGRPLFDVAELHALAGSAPPAISKRIALSRKEAASALDISARSVDRATQRGLLKGRKVGRRTVFSPDELKRFVQCGALN